VRTKPAEDQQGAKTGDVEKCGLGSTLWLLIVSSDRLESSATKAGYQQKRKRQKVETEDESVARKSKKAKYRREYRQNNLATETEAERDDRKSKKAEFNREYYQKC